MCYFDAPATPINPMAPLTVGGALDHRPYGTVGNGLNPHAEVLPVRAAPMSADEVQRFLATVKKWRKQQTLGLEEMMRRLRDARATSVENCITYATKSTG